MRLMSALNKFRSVVLGISFGDQAQFIRREMFADDFPVTEKIFTGSIMKIKQTDQVS
jgi:hypothetical protein